MTQEEKAKAYDEVREKIAIRFGSNVADEIFSQFEMSEDERIRKALLGYIKGVSEREVCKETLNEWIAWLEKQCEQKESYDTCISTTSNNKKLPYGEKRDFGYFEKQGEQEHVIIPKFSIGDTIRNKITNEVFTITYRCISLEYYSDTSHLHEVTFSEQDDWELVKQQLTDKVEPKFKVGDIIINKENGSISKVNKILSYDYELISFETRKHHILDQNLINENSKLWTIQDAKEGDVLAVEPIEENYQYPFVAIFKERGLDFFNSYCFIGFDGKFYKGENGHSTEKVHPATKEQRDLLFQKMKEAGYEWDAEKKELKEIEQNHAEDSCKNSDDITTEEKDRTEYKKGFECGKQRVLKYPEDFGLCKNTLTAWSEEDEQHIDSLLKRLEGLCRNEFERTRFAINEDENWLKFLKERYTWNPSDEQMKALKEACDKHWEPDGLDPLYTLYQDLKKLREE